MALPNGKAQSASRHDSNVPTDDHESEQAHDDHWKQYTGDARYYLGSDQPAWEIFPVIFHFMPVTPTKNVKPTRE